MKHTLRVMFDISFRNLQLNKLSTVLILFSIGNGKCHWIKFEKNTYCFMMYGEGSELHLPRSEIHLGGDG